MLQNTVILNHTIFFNQYHMTKGGEVFTNVYKQQLRDEMSSQANVFLFQSFPAAGVCRFQFQRRNIRLQEEVTLPLPVPSLLPDPSLTRSSCHGKRTLMKVVALW